MVNLGTITKLRSEYMGLLSWIYEPNVEQSIKACVTELDALERVKFGKVVDKAEAEKICKTHDVKIIGTRWIAGPKDIEGKPNVRTRLVVQQVAFSAIQDQLGFSSYNLRLRQEHRSGHVKNSHQHIISKLHISTLDVSKLPPGTYVCIPLPADISLSSSLHISCICNSSTSPQRPSLRVTRSEYLREIFKDLTSTPIPPKFELGKVDDKENQSVPLGRVGASKIIKNDLQLFVDASWGTPSVSGYCIFWRGNPSKFQEVHRIFWLWYFF